MREFQRFSLASTDTAARGGLEERVNYPDFVENHQFDGFYCVTLAYVLFSEEFPIQCRKKEKGIQKGERGEDFFLKLFPMTFRVEFGFLILLLHSSSYEFSRRTWVFQAQRNQLIVT